MEFLFQEPPKPSKSASGFASKGEERNSKILVESQDKHDKESALKPGKRNLLLKRKSYQKNKKSSPTVSIGVNNNGKRNLIHSYLEDSNFSLENNEKSLEDSNFSEVEISSTIAEFGDIEVKKKDKKQLKKIVDSGLKESPEEILATKFCEALDLTSSDEEEGFKIMIINPKKKIKTNVNLINKELNNNSTPETSDSEA